MPMTNRGNHPDLNPDGTWKDDAFLPPAERERNRIMRDPVARSHYMSKVAVGQSRLPAEVQRQVQGRTFSGEDEYQAAVQWYCQEYARRRGYERFVTNTEYRAMSPAESDEVTDQRTGLPLPGILLWDFDAVRIDDQMDAASRGELGNGRGGGR